MRWPADQRPGSSLPSALQAALQDVAGCVSSNFGQLGQAVDQQLHRLSPPAASSSGAFPRGAAHRPGTTGGRRPLALCSLTSSSAPGPPAAAGWRMPFGKKKAASDSKGSGSKPGQGNAKPEEEERILISEVEVSGVEGELRRVAQEALATKPNFAYTLKEVEDDLQRVFSTGWFSSCVPDAEDTRDGVKLVIKVTPNPELRAVTARGADALPARVMQDAFRHMHGRTLNYVNFAKAVEKLDRWYREHGVLGQVVDFSFEGGVVDLRVGEAVVNRLQLQFVDPKSGEPNDKGATRPEFITRHLNTEVGKVYSLRQAKQDIDSVYSTGLFEDVNIIPKESEGSSELQPRVDLTMNLVERKTGGLGAGTGVSAQGHGEGALPGFVGSFSYSQRNLFGRNQKLSALVELGQVDSLFRLQHTDPWMLGDPYRTSHTSHFMNTRTSGNAIHGPVDEDPGGGGGEEDDGSASGHSVVLGRLVSGMEFRRPLSTHWSGTIGANWQQSRCTDDKGQPLAQDCYGSPMTFSGGPEDTMLVVLASAAYSSLKDTMQLAVSTEQALPLRGDWLDFTRVRLKAEKLFSAGPLAACLRLRGGGIVGDLPPYEAFPIGGTNSVRGYSEGGVGSGRFSAEGNMEARYRLFKTVQGVLFLDYGTDFDSGASVIGDPAGARGKPGSGYGYGAGVRVDSPLGPVRLEYAWNDRHQSRFHVGLGYD